MLTETVGNTLLALFKETLQDYGSASPVIFEPFGYESLKTANQLVFGAHTLPSYRMEKADFLSTDLRILKRQDTFFLEKNIMKQRKVLWNRSMISIMQWSKERCKR